MTLRLHPAQIAIAVMYFTRWHVSSEFLSVAIAAQVTMCVQIDQAPHLGPNATVAPPPGPLPKHRRLGVHCCACAPFLQRVAPMAEHVSLRGAHAVPCCALARCCSCTGASSTGRGPFSR